MHTDINAQFAELNELISHLRNLTRTIEDLEAEAEATKDLIKEFMLQQDVDTLKGPDYKITWKPVTRSSLDTKALRNDQPELAAQYTKTQSYRQFILK